MDNQASISDLGYLDRKRRELIELRDSLRRTSAAAEAQETDTRDDSHLHANEYEDDAQRLDSLEKEGNLVKRDVRRLAQVQRALAKIAEGTYGLSDVSGERIPDARLEAMPDALNTVAEQEASERMA